MSGKIVNNIKKGSWGDESNSDSDNDSVQLVCIATKKSESAFKKSEPPSKVVTSDDTIIINVDSALGQNGRLDYKSAHNIVDHHMKTNESTKTSNRIPDGDYGFVSTLVEIWSNGKIQSSFDLIEYTCLQCLFARVIGGDLNMCTHHGVTEHGEYNGYATYSDGIPMDLYIYRFIGGKIGPIYRSDDNGILNRVPFRSKYYDIPDKPLLIANPLAHTTRGEDIFKNIIFKNVGTFKGSNDETSVASNTKEIETKAKEHAIVIKQKLPSPNEFPTLGAKSVTEKTNSKKSYSAIVSPKTVVEDEQVPTEFKQITAEKAQLIGRTIDISDESHSGDNDDEMSAVSLEQVAHGSVAEVETLKTQLELLKLRAEKAELEARLACAEKVAGFSQDEIDELAQAIEEEESINSDVSYSHMSHHSMDPMNQMQYQMQYMPGFMACDAYGNQRFVPYQQMCYPQPPPVNIAPPLNVAQYGNTHA